MPGIADDAYTVCTLGGAKEMLINSLCGKIIQNNTK